MPMSPRSSTSSYDLTEALERHYTAELIRRNYPRQHNSTEDSPDTNLADPPF